MTTDSDPLQIYFSFQLRQALLQITELIHYERDITHTIDPIFVIEPVLLYEFTRPGRQRLAFLALQGNRIVVCRLNHDVTVTRPVLRQRKIVLSRASGAMRKDDYWKLPAGFGNQNSDWQILFATGIVQALVEGLDCIWTIRELVSEFGRMIPLSCRLGPGPDPNQNQTDYD